MLALVLWLLLQTIVFGQTLDTRAPCRSVVDTLLYAGPERISWALDEPIETTVSRIAGLVIDQKCVNQLSAMEFFSANYIKSINEHQDSCRPKTIEAARVMRKAIGKEPRRAELFRGRPPAKLRVDGFLDEKLASIKAACKAMLAPVVVQRNLRLKQTKTGDLLARLARIKARAKSSSNSNQAKVVGDIHAEIVQSLARDCEFKKSTDPMSEEGRRTFNGCFFNHLIAPCEIVTDTNPTIELIVKVAVDGKLGEISQSIVDWIEQREVCTGYELEHSRTSSLIYEKFVKAVKAGEMQVKRAKFSIMKRG